MIKDYATAKFVQDDFAILAKLPSSELLNASKKTNLNRPSFENKQLITLVQYGPTGPRINDGNMRSIV